MVEEKTSTLNAQAEADFAPDNTYKRSYTIDEIRDALGISKTTAYNLVRSKQFHSVRVGGQFRISKKSFDNWLDGNKKGGDF